MTFGEIHKADLGEKISLKFLLPHSLGSASVCTQESSGRRWSFSMTTNTHFSGSWTGLLGFKSADVWDTFGAYVSFPKILKPIVPMAMSPTKKECANQSPCETSVYSTTQSKSNVYVLESNSSYEILGPWFLLWALISYLKVSRSIFCCKTQGCSLLN